MASMPGAMLKNGNIWKLSCKSTIRNQRETSALRCWNTPQKKMTVCGRLDKRIRLTTKQSSSLSGSEGEQARQDKPMQAEDPNVSGRLTAADAAHAKFDDFFVRIV